PIWVRSIPHNFSDARAGTLKADEWHTMVMIYLPLVLISLWGQNYKDHTNRLESQYCHILEHTMDLWVTSYHGHITSWLRSFPEAFPCASICPNYHMAIHIYDYLRLFGHVRAWWCFPYECLIGHLQHMLTNHRFEETVLQMFIQGSWIRCWLSHPGCPKVIQHCKFLFDKYLSAGENLSYDSTYECNKAPSLVPSDLCKLTSAKLHVFYPHI
ncbi:hypothetical protein PISMIDRAFT_97347, partial [Pisolithus microcarpus 441]